MRMRSLRSILWLSATWSIGVGAGVALGARLTVMGAAAAPGQVETVATEMVWLPLGAAAAFFCVSVIVRLARRGLSNACVRRSTTG